MTGLMTKSFEAYQWPVTHCCCTVLLIQ